MRTCTNDRAEANYIGSSLIRGHTNRLNAAAFGTPWLLLVNIALPSDAGHALSSINALNVIRTEHAGIERQNHMYLLVTEVHVRYICLAGG
jgi:hypothetical protein